MQYDTKPIQRETSVIKLSRSEYDGLNAIYQHGIKIKGGVTLDTPSDLKFIILTDGYYRLELEVEQV